MVSRGKEIWRRKGEEIDNFIFVCLSKIIRGKEKYGKGSSEEKEIENLLKKILKMGEEGERVRVIIKRMEMRKKEDGG